MPIDYTDYTEVDLEWADLPELVVNFDKLFEAVFAEIFGHAGTEKGHSFEEQK